MSALIALHCGRFVLFGSDTRQVWYTDKTLTKIRRAKDGQAKLQAGSVGLIGGTGVIPLVDAGMRRLEEALRSRSTWAEMLDMIALEQAAFWSTTTLRREDEGNGTGWLLTYAAPDGIRLATYHPMQGHGFFRVPAGDVVTVIPEPGSSHARAYLKDKIQPCQADEPIAESVVRHIRVLREALAQAALETPTVSRDSVIGLHVDTGKVWVKTFPPITALTPVASPTLAAGDLT